MAIPSSSMMNMNLICRFISRKKYILHRINSLGPQNLSQSSKQDVDNEFQLHFLDGELKGIAVFSLRRFRYRNAMGRNLMRKFMDATQELKLNQDISLVIIRSEVPGVFCAGADLKERMKMTEQELSRYSIHTLRYSLTEVANLPMPTIAAVDGAALGGGLEMALACDLRIMASTAKIGLVETSLAIIPGAGGTQRLPRLIGGAKAKELMFTSRVIDGKQANEMGISNYCVDQNETGDAAYQRALELAHQILAQGPLAVRMAKAAIDRGSEVDIDSGLKYEEAYYAQLIPTKDRIEALKAFHDKRRPKFEGH